MLGRLSSGATLFEALLPACVSAEDYKRTDRADHYFEKTASFYSYVEAQTLPAATVRARISNARIALHAVERFYVWA